MLVPDEMHEIELGEWKKVFMHLIRMLSAVNADLLVELNHRYVLCVSQYSGSLTSIPGSVKCLRSARRQYDASTAM